MNMEDPDSYTIVFEPDELIVLERMLTPSEVSTPLDKGFLPPDTPSKLLCLKIGCAWAQAMEIRASTPMAFTEAELWILRERVTTQDMVGRNPVGFTIKAKVYGALGAMDAAGAMPSLPTTEHQEPSAKEVCNALDARAMRGDGDPHTDDADHDANDAATP